MTRFGGDAAPFNGRVLTLPPMWAPAGGALVSEPALLVRDGSALPDRRSALR